MPNLIAKEPSLCNPDIIYYAQFGCKRTVPLQSNMPSLMAVGKLLGTKAGLLWVITAFWLTLFRRRFGGWRGLQKKGVPKVGHLYV